MGDVRQLKVLERLEILESLRAAGVDLDSRSKLRRLSDSGSNRGSSSCISNARLCLVREPNRRSEWRKIGVLAAAFVPSPYIHIIITALYSAHACY
jgi:hypothetical protein